MKYMLINRKTQEEHLCDKVTIDGFEYYVSDDIRDYFYDKTINRIIKSNGDVEGYKDYSEYFKGVIATNNPNIDIPKVVDEVDLLSYINKLANQRFTGWTNDEMKGYKTALISITEFYKSQETHPFSEEDMIEFHKWAFQQVRIKESDLTTKELLQLWKEQKTKIVYYEN